MRKLLCFGLMLAFPLVSLARTIPITVQWERVTTANNGEPILDQSVVRYKLYVCNGQIADDGTCEGNLKTYKVNPNNMGDPDTIVYEVRDYNVPDEPGSGEVCARVMTVDQKTKSESELSNEDCKRYQVIKSLDPPVTVIIEWD